MNEFFSTPIGGYVLAFLQVFCGLMFFWLAQRLYQLVFRRIHLSEEIFVRDNVAAAVALSGFFLGVLLSLGGTAAELPKAGVESLFALFSSGLVAVFFMLLGAFVSERLILRRCDCFCEICNDRNLGAGFVEAGTHIANGLLISSALAGGCGSWLVGLVCWCAGMLVLAAAASIYPVMARFDVNGEIRNRNNAAAGLAFAGFLAGMGNILRISFAGDFTGWQSSLPEYAIKLVFSFVLMGFIRWFADLILVPGVTLSGEIVDESIPNIGAGLIEAFCYIAGSFLIGIAFPP